jgi:protein arginine kinase
MVLKRYDSPGTWLSGDGPESDIVISSRIRLARNIEGFPFVGRMEGATKHDFIEYILRRISPLSDEYGLEWIDVAELNRIDRELLLERHLISRGIVSAEGARGILVNAEENIAIMLNEEDHLRIQYLASGLQLHKVWQNIEHLDDLIAGNVDYSFDPELGYLTSCPTNLGTGIRVSVMLHIPGLNITKQISKVFNAVSRIGLTVRGLFGEGTEGIGDFYQVSNQITLGATEMDIINKVGSVIPRIIAYERKARDILLREKRVLLEDKVCRAYGVLKHAHSLSSQETLTLLSLIRLGIHLGILSDLEIRTVNNLFIYSQPSHLQKREKREMEPSERDELRADYLRKILSS